jgi:predicted enzyme related to lactoylglutathione lyase
MSNNNKQRGMPMLRQRMFVALLAASTIVSCAVTDAPDTSGMSFSDQPLLGKAVWHDLITEDISAARTFYSGLFGWTLESAKAANGGQYLLARHANVYVAGILEVSPRTDGQKISRWLPYISVSDVDTSAALTKATGGTVVISPRDVGFGRVAAIADPAGAIIGLARSEIGDPDDATTAPVAGAVVWNELLSNDSKAAATFYERVFAYEAVQTSRRGGEYTMLRAAGKDRAGILANPAPEWEPVWLTYFGVSDPSAAAARATQLGGRIIAPVSDELRDGTMAVVADPSGAILVLQKIPM